VFFGDGCICSEYTCIYFINVGKNIWQNSSYSVVTVIIVVLFISINITVIILILRNFRVSLINAYFRGC
jgi:hypothetical protein